MLKIGRFDPKETTFQPIAILHSKTSPRDGMSLMVDTSQRCIVPTRDVQLPDGEYFALEPSNMENHRDVIMVGGKSGSGKSHTAKNFAIRYHMLWPRRPIRLISYLKEDETLDALKFIERVDIEKFRSDESSTELKKYEKSLTIFDDIEGFQRDDPDIHDKLQQVIDMIATTGRHTQSSLLVASHLLTDYKRYVLRTGRFLVVMPAFDFRGDLYRAPGQFASPLGHLENRKLYQYRPIPQSLTAIPFLHTGTGRPAGLGSFWARRTSSCFFLMGVA